MFIYHSCAGWCRTDDHRFFDEEYIAGWQESNISIIKYRIPEGTSCDNLTPFGIYFIQWNLNPLKVMRQTIPLALLFFFISCCSTAQEQVVPESTDTIPPAKSLYYL